MEKAFDTLQKEGKNDVDNLVKWMRDAKVIENTHDSEEKAKQTFADVAGTGEVTLEQFKEVLTKLAAESSLTVEKMLAMLSSESTAVASAVQAAATTFFKG